MTANDMKFSLMLKFDSLFEFASPEYDDRHISYILTEAERRVFMRKYNPLSDKFQSGFESNEQRRKELDQLIRSARIQSGKTETVIVENCYVYEDRIVLPDNGDSSVAGDSFEIGMKVYVTDVYIEVYAGGYATVVEIITDSIIRVDKFTQTRTGDSTPWDGNMPITSCLGRSASGSGVHPNGVFYDLPSDFLYAIEESARLGYIDGGGNPVILPKESWVKPVKHDEYLPNINNPYKKPYKNLVWRMDISRNTQPSGDIADINSGEGYVVPTRKRVELIKPTGYFLEYYRLRYLALPPAIVCDEFNPGDQRHCILDESIHADIVDEAVVIIKAAVKQDEYQISLAEKQRSQ
jgi:hypothetical protein